MSKLFSAKQYEKAYKPCLLGNWEIPDDNKSKASSAASKSYKTEDGRTVPIVDERGHLLVKKKPAAFNTRPPNYLFARPRWPEDNPTIKHSPVATMGYKGIQINYLPSSTPENRQFARLQKTKYH